MVIFKGSHLFQTPSFLGYPAISFRGCKSPRFFPHQSTHWIRWLHRRLLGQKCTHLSLSIKKKGGNHGGNSSGKDAGNHPEKDPRQHRTKSTDRPFRHACRHFVVQGQSCIWFSGYPHARIPTLFGELRTLPLVVKQQNIVGISGGGKKEGTLFAGKETGF